MCDCWMLGFNSDEMTTEKFIFLLYLSLWAWDVPYGCIFNPSSGAVRFYGAILIITSGRFSDLAFINVVRQSRKFKSELRCFTLKNLTVDDQIELFECVIVLLVDSINDIA